MSLYGFYQVGAGRCHSECEILIHNRGGSSLIKPDKKSSYSFWIDTKRLTPMGANHRFVPILWAGGWDEYIIDINQIRPMTPREIEIGQKAVDEGRGLPPILEGYWLRGLFCPEFCKKEECIKIFQHIGGGD